MADRSRGLRRAGRRRRDHLRRWRRRPGSTEPTAFDLPAIEGEQRIRLADFAGTPTVVNFFASWCTACDAELPGFAEVSRELEGEVSFVGVNSLETGDALLTGDSGARSDP